MTKLWKTILMEKKFQNWIYSNEQQGRLDSFSTALVHSIDSIFVQRGDDKNVRISLRMHEIRLRDAILRRDSKSHAITLYKLGQ